MKSILLFIFLSTSTCIFSQDDETNWESQFVEKHFLIAASTKSYSSAKKTAEKLSKSIKLEIENRGLVPFEESGLSFSLEECEGSGWEYPCYVERGPEDGTYISIEWSNAIDGFSKGYYVVIVSTQSERSEKMKNLLLEVKKVKSSAYIKSAKVYIGCMH